MKNYILFFAIGVIFLTGCIKNRQKIDYKENPVTDSLTLENIKNDTTKTIVARLPVFFDSTGYIIHPIEVIIIDKTSGKRKFFDEFSSYSQSNARWNDYGDERYGDIIYGNFINLNFENLTTGEQRLLTHNAVKVTVIQYLRSLAVKLPKYKYLIYRVYDYDSNHDGKLNNGDITSLYISKLDGQRFTKLTKPSEELKSGELILQNLKYYFSTIEDTNKDGYFNSGDHYHYYYLDFSKNPFSPQEYFPLAAIKK